MVLATTLVVIRNKANELHVGKLELEWFRLELKYFCYSLWTDNNSINVIAHIKRGMEAFTDSTHFAKNQTKTRYSVKSGFHNLEHDGQ